VAPVSFGRYGGDLVAPGETSGRVFAIGPDDSVVTLVVSSLPHGGDIGVESAGFVPPGFSAGGAAYLADRFSKGNRHPGTDSILRLPGHELISAGVHAGDLLVATEASARTIVVRCASSCTARYIAADPAITQAEGHIAFTSAVGPLPGAGAGGRLTDARPEVAAGFHRPAGTPRPKLMTEAK
jgi:hypothetical protein